MLSHFVPTDQVMGPGDLASLLCEPLPAGDVIVAAAGEWRREPAGTWRFWQDLAWVPGDFEDSPIPVSRQNP